MRFCYQVIKHIKTVYASNILKTETDGVMNKFACLSGFECFLF